MVATLHITDLNAEQYDNELFLECPCGQGHSLHLRTTTGEGHHDADGYVWHIEGEFPNVTLHHSINAGCWHGFIKKGEVT